MTLFSPWLLKQNLATHYDLVCIRRPIRTRAILKARGRRGQRTGCGLLLILNAITVSLSVFFVFHTLRPNDDFRDGVPQCGPEAATVGKRRKVGIPSGSEDLVYQNALDLSISLYTPMQTRISSI